MARVFVPALMRKLSNEEPVVDIPGNTLREVVNNLDDAYPGMKDLIIENGRVRPGLALAVDGVMSATGLMAKVPEDGEVHILPAIGGG